MKNTLTERIAHLRNICPLPVLLEQVGLKQFAKPSCPSPFRHDKHPSWGIFQDDRGRWQFYDFVYPNPRGNEVSFLAQLFRLDEKHNLAAIVDIYQKIADNASLSVPAIEKTNHVTTPEAETQLPDGTNFGKGTDDQLQRLSQLRNYRHDVLVELQERENLVFGFSCGSEVFGIRDRSGRVIEVRRLDGLQFPACGPLHPRKSHCLKHSNKKWPVGIFEAKDTELIVITEGLPDFIAGWQVIKQEQAHHAACVCMLGACPAIHQVALERFKSKKVKIIPHLDQPGVEAALNWRSQLLSAGATTVDLIDLSPLCAQKAGAKDLDDVKLLHAEAVRNNPSWRLL